MGVPVKVTIDSELLAVVDELGIDIQQAVRQAVDRKMNADRAAKEFYDANRDAIDSYNAYVDKHGTVGSRHGLRRG